jgi:DNA primase
MENHFTAIEREKIFSLSQFSLYETSEDAEEARRYLFDVRKIDEKVIKEFNIGYVPVRVHDKRISGKVIFPIFDCHNNLVAISTRDFRNISKNRGHWHESFNKKHHVYGWSQAIDSVKKSNEIIVVEGQFDVMAMHSHGYTNCIGILGSHLSIFHALLLVRYANSIIFMFDNDEAGRKAYSESINVLGKIGLLYDKTISFFSVDLGAYKDPDELLKCSSREDMEMHIVSSQNRKQQNERKQWSTNVSDLSID